MGFELYLRVSFYKNLFYFQKFNYVRYLNFFLFGIIISKFFLIKLKYKIVSFLKANLFLFLDQCFIFSYFEKNINFLGYNIFLTKNLYFSTFFNFGLMDPIYIF